VLDAANEEEDISAEGAPAAKLTGGTANVEADHDTMTAEVAIAVGIYFSVATGTDSRANKDLSSAVSSTKVG
jgi:hypothetical protein